MQETKETNSIKGMTVLNTQQVDSKKQPMFLLKTCQKNEFSHSYERTKTRFYQ
jgi:hypothetical protein